ncbi:MAG TPA: hypothetical protein VGL93_14180 [Streptosporangiaceae bacterium]|jgi:hypothetical protein
MELLPYVAQLQRELAVAAEAGGDDARLLAERLTAPLESATRLVLLEALSEAAGEITQELEPGSVDVRLHGRDPAFVVTPPPDDPSGAGDAAAPSAAPPPPAAPEGDEGGTARISLRLPDHLKPRIEEAAGRAGLSVNAWLVRAVSAALDGGDGGSRAERRESLGRRYTGWVR